MMQPCIGFRSPKQNWQIQEGSQGVGSLEFHPYTGINADDVPPLICLEVEGGSTADGANVRIATCSQAGVSFQSWTVDFQNNGYLVKAVHSNSCLEAVGGSLQQNTCSGATSQKWLLLPPANANFFLFPQHQLNPFEPASLLGLIAPPDPSINIEILVGFQFTNQLWTFPSLNSGLQLKNHVESNGCAEVANFSLADNANVQDATCTDAANKEWRLQPMPVGLGVGSIVPFQIITATARNAWTFSVQALPTGPT